jgi:2-phospho-L-lactate guanylyltransferase
MPDVRADGDLWTVLIPVKRLDIAKSRLALPDRVRADLALAMASDTVSAALGCAAVAEVLVITSDESAAAALSALGARIVDDVPDSGLNAALVHGASLAVAARLCALAGDLPALRSIDLETILRLAAAHRVAVVADAAGSGTTVLTAASLAEFMPQFGIGSRAAHLDVAPGGGAAFDLSVDAAASLRHDVDTIDALDAAVELGVGPATAQVLAALGS